MDTYIYHGSENIIKVPEYGSGKLHNDYGRGFYCTEDMELASEWAVDENRDGYVNSYSIDLSGLDITDLSSDKYTVLHWLSVLISNRIFDLNTPLMREAYRYLREIFFVDTENTDIITGYRADDSYFSFAQDFLSGQISVSQLSKALQLGNLGEQITLKSQRSFDRIKYIKNIPVFSTEWYLKKKSRDDKARLEYRKMNKTDYVPGELYMIRILDEEVKPDDPRIQRSVLK